MKKVFLSLTAIFLLSGLSFAQEEAPAPETKPSFSESLSTRAGINFVYDLPVGDLADFIKGATGPQLLFEGDIPLNNSLKLGASLSASYLYGITDSDVLDSFSCIRAGAGVFVRIPASQSVVFQPELDWGTSIFIVTDPEDKLSSPYFDQYLTLSCALRYAPVSLGEGKLEFNICPAFTLGPESGYNANFAGVRAGFVYKIKSTAAEEEARVKAVEEYKAARAAAAEKKAAEKEAKAAAKAAEEAEKAQTSEESPSEPAAQ